MTTHKIFHRSLGILIWFIISMSIIFAVSAATIAETVRVAICQMEIDGDVPENLAKAEDFVRQAAEAGAKICVLPELVDVGFGSIVKAPTGAELARPIPGETSDKLGEIAVKYDMWIATALLEAVPGGVYDTNTLIDNRGKVVLKQRKAFAYPAFGGGKCYQGNYHDAQVANSPWGPLGVMNCADTGSRAKRLIFPDQQPVLMLVSFANPQANLLKNCAVIAAECGSPVVGTNMVFSTGKQPGGRSAFYSANGILLWKAPASVEMMKTWDLTLTPPDNLRPRVDAGNVQTICLPDDTVTLNGYVTDDGLSNGSLATEWSQVSAPAIVSFSDPDSPITTAQFPTSGVYILRLTANDGELSDADEVAINVLPQGEGELNLAGYWPFDNTPDDQSGNANDGVIIGDPIYSTDVAPTGLPNSHSLDLDGEVDYVKVEHHPSLSAPTSVTIAMWVKPRSYPGFYPTGNDWSQLINKGSKWGEQNYMLGFGAYFYLHSDSMGMRIPCLDDAIRTPNQWYHVAAVIDSIKNLGKIYINGVLDHSVYNVANAITNSDALYIGRGRPNSESPTDGKIDDVRVYTRALSDAEIAAFVPGAVINQPPEIDAGPDRTVSISSSALLQGTYADDEIPATSSIARWTAWRKVSGPGSVRFENRYDLATSVTFTQPGVYVLELQASDGAHLAHDTVKLVVHR